MVKESEHQENMWPLAAVLVAYRRLLWIMAQDKQAFSTYWKSSKGHGIIVQYSSILLSLAVVQGLITTSMSEVKSSVSVSCAGAFVSGWPTCRSVLLSWFPHTNK